MVSPIEIIYRRVLAKHFDPAMHEDRRLCRSKLSLWLKQDFLGRHVTAVRDQRFARRLAQLRVARSVAYCTFSSSRTCMDLQSASAGL